MQRNFKIGQSNELIHMGKLYDVVNLYSFAGVLITPNNKVSLFFRAIAGYPAEFGGFAVDICGIARLELTPRVQLGLVSEVDEVGYKSPDDSDMDWLLGEEQCCDGDDFIVSFGAHDHVRVRGRCANLRSFGHGLSLPWE